MGDIIDRIDRIRIDPRPPGYPAHRILRLAVFAWYPIRAFPTPPVGYPYHYYWYTATIGLESLVYRDTGCDG